MRAELGVKVGSHSKAGPLTLSSCLSSAHFKVGNDRVELTRMGVICKVSETAVLHHAQRRWHVGAKGHSSSFCPEGILHPSFKNHQTSGVEGALGICLIK